MFNLKNSDNFFKANKDSRPYLNSCKYAQCFFFNLENVNYKWTKAKEYLIKCIVLFNNLKLQKLNQIELELKLWSKSM